MTHETNASANAADVHTGIGAAEAEGTAACFSPGDAPIFYPDAPTPNPKVSRRSAPTSKAKKHPRPSSLTVSPRASRPVRGATRGDTSKADQVLKKLRQTRGATVPQIMEATGWQAHSVRGFLSAVVRKKLGLDLTSEAGKDGVRRYRIAGDASSGTA